jgi:uncharacterized protein (TIGR04255 family)
MAVRPHLKNAPIIEAVVDIKTIPSLNYSPEKLRSFHEKVKNFLPIYEDAFQIEAQFQVGVSPVSAQEKKTECARLKNVDSSYIALVHSSSISLSKINPYTNWDDLREKTKFLWELYKSELNPQIITRLALRYINRIDIEPGARIEDSFKTFPALSETLPQVLAGYRLQLVLPSEDQLSTAVINQVYDPAIGAPMGVASIIFDIDAFQNVQMDPTSDEIWSVFETLHSFKNDVFFESLTESTRKKYI